MFDDLLEVFDRRRRRPSDGSRPEQRRGLLGALGRVFGGSSSRDSADGRSRYQDDHWARYSRDRRDDDDERRDRPEHGDDDDERRDRRDRRRGRDGLDFGDDD